MGAVPSPAWGAVAVFNLAISLWSRTLHPMSIGRPVRSKPNGRGSLRGMPEQGGEGRGLCPTPRHGAEDALVLTD